jgi:hypothetical protein
MIEGTYYSIPSSVEALQWTGDNVEQVIEFVSPKGARFESGVLVIGTLNEPLFVELWEVIIKYPHGRFKIKKEKQFTEMYVKDLEEVKVVDTPEVVTPEPIEDGELEPEPDEPEDIEPPATHKPIRDFINNSIKRKKK